MENIKKYNGLTEEEFGEYISLFINNDIEGMKAFEEAHPDFK